MNPESQECQRVRSVTEISSVSVSGRSWLQCPREGKRGSCTVSLDGCTWFLCASRTVRVLSCPVLCECRVAAARGISLPVRSAPTCALPAQCTAYTAAAVCVPTCAGSPVALYSANRRVLPWVKRPPLACEARGGRGGVEARFRGSVRHKTS